MIKKVFMFAVMLCCTLSSFAEEKSIKLEKEKRPHGRSEVQLPTASIDDQVLTISFSSSCSFEVTVVNESGAVVYTCAYNAQGTIITLPNLPVGDYELKIEDAEYLYSGKFCIAY